MTEPLKLGPWPLGLDNVHEPRHAVFQVPSNGGAPARLAGATDVALSDDGWPSTRPQVATVAALTAGSASFSALGTLFYQDGASLYQHGVSPARLTGLVRPVSYATYGDRLFISDGTSHYEWDGTTVRRWGLPVPEITLAATAGSTFAAGTYQVQCAFTDGRNEGGASAIAEITLATAADIQVTVAAPAGEMPLGINQDITGMGRKGIFYAKSVVTSGTGAQVFLAAAATTDLPVVTGEMQGPPAGLTGLAPFRAFLMTWRDNAVFRSESVEPHLFHPENIYQTPGTVLGGAEATGATQSVFWIAETNGLWTMVGDDPPFRLLKVYSGKMLEGAMSCSASWLSFLNTSGDVALFVSQHGLLIGLPDGTVLTPTRDRYHVDTDTYSKVSFAYVERNKFRQLLWSLS